MKRFSPTGLVILAGSAALLLAGCEKENRAEQVGQQIEQSFEAARADFQQAQERVEEKAAPQDPAKQADQGEAEGQQQSQDHPAGQSSGPGR